MSVDVTAVVARIGTCLENRSAQGKFLTENLFSKQILGLVVAVLVAGAGRLAWAEDPPGGTTLTPKTSEAARASEPREALTPIPDAKYLGPAAIEITSFQGVTPGTSTREVVEKAWGQPKQVRKQDNLSVHLYSVDPFPRVEVCFQGEKVMSIIIRFEKSFAADTVAQQLDLAKVQPVLVSNELGEILGQAYPERGVLFSFEPPKDPGKTLKKVTHIVLEPITADPFILRAETNLDNRPEFSLHDLDEALKLQSDNARAHWLRSRVLTSLGEYEKAAAAATAAVRLEPNDARYLTTRARALAQVGRVNEGLVDANKAMQTAGQRVHLKARALCLLGDLKASASAPDFKQAYQHHLQAIQTADPLTASRHPAIRLAAKEVLLDAYLGGAHDIAWGEWRDKEKAVEPWLQRAAGFAEDLVKNEGGGEEYLFRLGARALAAYVGINGKLDPTSWAKLVHQNGEALIAATPDAARQSQLRWEMSISLYDAMQLYQMRADHEAALKYGELAINYLEKSGRQHQSAVTAYLLGRLSFRMGAVHALRNKDHATAVAWFDKATPLLKRTPPPDAAGDVGRLGETFVSMGISYWETGKHSTAVELTQYGTGLMEEAVRKGLLAKSALAVPYANLASMHRRLGAKDKAERLEEMATRIKSSQVR